MLIAVIIGVGGTSLAPNICFSPVLLQNILKYTLAVPYGELRASYVNHQLNIIWFCYINEYLAIFIIKYSDTDRLN
ncbi:hypothetical protein [Pseudochrobactrum sp. MP213Fo]|uniref:hypothetical protein n=1 Tax=Pseudochrobactrum sp. MP213Fo TaxID=3022250 RepID=UPI003B9F066A